MDDCVRRLRAIARQPHRRDRPRDGPDALHPPRLRLPRHRPPRGRVVRRRVRRATPHRARGDAARAAAGVRRLRAPRARDQPAPRQRRASSRPQGGTVGVCVRVARGALRAPRRRQRARACRPSAPIASSIRSTRSTDRPRARTAASASASRSRGAWRAGSAATFAVAGGATVEGSVPHRRRVLADRREARADGRRRLHELTASGHT